jgi:HSP20 family protein
MSTTLVAPELRPMRFLRDEWPFGRLFDNLRDLEPAIRVEERIDGDTLIIKAEAPGIDPDKDVELSMANGKLFMTVERRESSEKKEDGNSRSEFRYGSFSRTIPLPEGTPSTDVKASYKDGILEVRVPMPPAKAAATKVPVTRG